MQLIFGESDMHQVDGKLLLIISKGLFYFFSFFCSQRKAFSLENSLVLLQREH